MNRQALEDRKQGLDHSRNLAQVSCLEASLATVMGSPELRPRQAQARFCLPKRE